MATDNPKPSEILKAVIAALKTDPAKFSREIGNERPDNIYKVLEEKAKPSWDTLIKIANHYRHISAEFLLRGKGSIFLNPKAIPQTPQEKDLLLIEKDKTIEILQRQIEFLKTLIPKTPHP